MRSHGILVKWNDERGFGFIQPANGGVELFVHVSAFPRDSARPAIGESISFEIETKPDGKHRAIRIMRPLAISPGASPRRHGHLQREHDHRRVPRRSISWSPVLAALAAAATGYYAYQQVDWSYMRPSTTAADTLRVEPRTGRSSADFRCDGRTRCPQMRSCEEATFFLRNCPNTEMDGDRDGIPCESQWCD